MRVTAQFALKNVAPDAALAIWGARLNVDRHGHVDLPPDRFGSDNGPYSTVLTNLIDARYPIRLIRETISHLLSDGLMSMAESRDVILYLDQQLTVHADLRASHGYCYITAWLTSSRTTNRAKSLIEPTPESEHESEHESESETADPEDVLHHITVGDVETLTGIVLTASQADRVRDQLATALTSILNDLTQPTELRP